MLHLLYIKMNLLNTYITSDLHIGSNLIASTRGFDYWEKAWLDYKNHLDLLPPLIGVPI